MAVAITAHKMKACEGLALASVGKNLSSPDSVITSCLEPRECLAQGSRDTT